MYPILIIIITGYAILIGAMLLNWLAVKFGLMTWYDVFKSSKKLNSISIIWLFLIYPASLGLIAYFSIYILAL